MTEADVKFVTINEVPDDATLSKLVACANKLIDETTLEAWKDKLSDRAAVFISYAESAGTVVGFKVGYELKPTLFYSWVGGVLDAHRNKGIATQMINDQLNFCSTNGFTVIKAISDNRYKDMMICNLRAGFDFCETKLDDEGILRVVMEKKL
jgi:hypothetical protein